MDLGTIIMQYDDTIIMKDEGTIIMGPQYGKKIIGPIYNDKVIPITEPKKYSDTIIF